MTVYITPDARLTELYGEGVVDILNAVADVSADARFLLDDYL